MYTNSVDVAQGTPTYVHALREAGYHTAQVGKAHLTNDQYEADVRHVDDLAYRLEERGFAEVHETTDKFTGTTPNAWTDALEARRARRVPEVHRRPQLRGRARQRSRCHEDHPDVGGDPRPQY